MVTNLNENVDVTENNTGMITGLTPILDPVYDPSHASYKHNWEDAEGYKKSYYLIKASDVKIFFKNVPMLDNERIKGLKDEGTNIQPILGNSILTLSRLLSRVCVVMIWH